MKILKTLLPIATLASTATIAAPIVCSCSNGMTMIDVSKEFTPTVKQYTPSTEESAGVNETKALEIYLTESNKNSEVIRQDALVSVCPQTVPTGLSAKIGIKVNKIDTTNKTVDFEVKMTNSGSYTRNDSTLTTNTEASIKVTNAPIVLDYHDSTWRTTIGTYKFTEFGNEKIVGKLSGTTTYTEGEIKSEYKYSGNEYTITKDSTEPTEEQAKEEFAEIILMAREQFDS